MQISLPGFLVCVGLLLTGFLARAPAVVPLFASFAFGATAVVNLPSLGGSSPLIYTVFIAWLCAAVLVRRHLFRELGVVFSRHRVAFVVVAVIAYAGISAYLLPRLFAGEAHALVTVRDMSGAGIVVEAPLAPTGGNITQSGYFILGALAFFAMSVLLLKPANFTRVRTGYIAWAVAQASLGLIDWAAKIAGAGDVLAPIRTASYAMLTNVEQGGFSRVVGGFSEASAFGSTTLACLAYAFADWRVSRSPRMLALVVLLAILLVMSTSSTAYVALTVVLIPVGTSIALSLLMGRVPKTDLLLLFILIVGVTAAFGIYVIDSSRFDPFVKLFEATILNKASSSSGVERLYWNEVSLRSVLDTYLLGVGFGSSRASSWAVAVISQIGAFGALLMAVLAAQLLPRMRRRQLNPGNVEVVALHQGARAAAFCGIVTGSIAGGSADPGALFFISLCVVLSCRYFAYDGLGRAGRTAHSSHLAFHSVKWSIS